MTMEYELHKQRAAELERAAAESRRARRAAPTGRRKPAAPAAERAARGGWSTAA
ncbi:hypothetical protein [Streptomyces sp. G-5]|jgi:hypothetical protein|uniref:hypothetical protein n=1 Tax=Streptomyces TaxID=1883 RepID=UPI0021D3E247|nr:hypothetical protein [Streptomyces sp. G-5]MCU4749427.1 hypothetical protein [Streptomyces sp. G-5]